MGEMADFALEQAMIPQSYCQIHKVYFDELMCCPYCEDIDLHNESMEEVNFY